MTFLNQIITDDSGINIYNQQVQQLLGTIDPSKQEELRVAGRDLWRLVLSTTFSSVVSDDDLESQAEVSIVDARNIMHKVSQRMMSTEVLERVAKICGGVVVLDPNGAVKRYCDVCVFACGHMVF